MKQSNNIYLFSLRNCIDDSVLGVLDRLLRLPAISVNKYSKNYKSSSKYQSCYIIFTNINQKKALLEGALAENRVEDLLGLRDRALDL